LFWQTREFSGKKEKKKKTKGGSAGARLPWKGESRQHERGKIAVKPTLVSWEEVLNQTGKSDVLSGKKGRKKDRAE